MTLDELVSQLEILARFGNANPELRGVTHDSRQVKPGWLFVAIPGLRQDGIYFLRQAIESGAVAAIGEANAPKNCPIPYLRVANARQVLALSSWAVAGNPHQKLELIAVTGTNGKTTIANILAYALNAMDIPSAVSGTLGISFPGEIIPGVRTTPEASDLAPALSEMVRRSMRTCVMEATSIGLALDRLHGLPFSNAIFTNLSRDHLDFHGSWEAYLDAKLKLFRELPGDSLAIVNRDDNTADVFIAASRAPVATYALEQSADFAAFNLSLTHDQIAFTVREREQEYEVATPMIGRFNVYNLLAVIAVLRSRGISAADIQLVLKQLPPVRGRAEVVRSSAPFTVIIDYAHTPDALEKTLGSLRDLNPKRLITVIGAGGDRDRGKRPEMTITAETGSDFVHLTSDNPRSEDPEQIIDDMWAGVKDHTKFKRNPDRCAAIVNALFLAKPNDIILIAGKGHETYQEIQGVFHDFDDRQVVRKWLIKAGYNC